MRTDDLHEILIGGDDDGIDLLLDAGGCERRDDVIGLDAFAHDALDAERIDHAIDVWNLHLQVVGGLVAIGFVFGKKIVAEGALGRIENRADMRRMVLLDELEEHPDEAEHRVGRHSARVVERWEGEEGAEDIVRAIDQKKLLPLLRHNRMRLSDAHWKLNSPSILSSKYSPSRNSAERRRAIDRSTRCTIMPADVDGP